MEGRCARHPEVPAILTCERCGAFACEACVDDFTALCASCVEAGHAGRVVPWEAPVGGGFWATMLDAWARPRTLFGGLMSGDPNRAFSFAVLASLFYYLPLVVAALIVAPERGRSGGEHVGEYVGGIFCATPCCAGVGELVACAVLAFILYFAGAIAGSGASFGDVFRLAAYSQAYLVVLAPAQLANAFSPIVGGLLGLVTFPLLAALQINAYQAYYQHRQRRTPIVAGLVASAPLLCAFALCGTAFVVGILAGMREAMSHPP